MNFCTVINCMDGRVQLPVITYLQKRFDTQYVDSITEAGPNRLVAEWDSENPLIQSIQERLRISVEVHGSAGIALVGHHDCAGNPATKEAQLTHIKCGVEHLSAMYEQADVIGLWVDETWQVQEVM